MQDGKTWLKRHDQDGTIQISKMLSKKRSSANLIIEYVSPCLLTQSRMFDNQKQVLGL